LATAQIIVPLRGLVGREQVTGELIVGIEAVIAAEIDEWAGGYR
jgi:hypothetical protein